VHRALRALSGRFRISGTDTVDCLASRLNKITFIKKEAHVYVSKQRESAPLSPVDNDG